MAATQAILVLAFISNGQPQVKYEFIDGGWNTGLENAMNICMMQGEAWRELDTMNHVVFQCIETPRRKEM